jgi:hypothetical protein
MERKAVRKRDPDTWGRMNKKVGGGVLKERGQGVGKLSPLNQHSSARGKTI